MSSLSASLGATTWMLDLAVATRQFSISDSGTS
jgi:hypothetical protein